MDITDKTGNVSSPLWHKNGDLSGWLRWGNAYPYRVEFARQGLLCHDSFGVGVIVPPVKSQNRLLVWYEVSFSRGVVGFHFFSLFR